MSAKRAKSSATEQQPLRKSPMMAHLWDALCAGTDVGHYGRFVFAVVARHFLEEETIVELLASQPGEDETSARAMMLQVREHDYNPPTRERILQWQSQQEFAICPTPDDPASCNVYRELEFPDGIYSHIEQYWEQRAEHS